MSIVFAAPPILTIEDLPGFTPADQWMVDDALAMAARIAPCLTTTLDPSVLAAAKAILRRSVMRWKEAGNGAVTQQTAGPYSQSMEVRNSRGLFWPSEITDLQQLCNDGVGGGAYEVDTMPPTARSGRRGYWATTTDWVPL